MDAAAAGLRLRLRQAALRPPPRAATPGRCASISTRASTTRTSWPASWKTTTSRGRRRRSRPGVHEAAAVITFLSPGLRFFHQGQFEGRKKRISPHLGRGPSEPVDAEAAAVLRPAARPSCVSRPCATATGNCSNAPRPGTATGRTIASWPSPGKGPTTSGCSWSVNYAPNQSQCHVRLPFADLGRRAGGSQDQLGDAATTGTATICNPRPVPGHAPGWQIHVFSLNILS